jgi:predicted alpha/beta hydrolase
VSALPGGTVAATPAQAGKPGSAQEVDLSAADGYRLGALLYPAAPAPSGRAPARVVIAPATGVPQLFYRRFAEHLARAGHEVLSLDYRGIGRSKRGGLRGFAANFLDWAEKDLQAAVAWSLARGPTAVVGHSFGGQVYGLLPSVEQTLGLYTFGSGAGWMGHMPLAERPRAWALWNLLAPVLVWRCGYLPSRRLGLGEDLPLGVYRHWRAWCSHPRYFFEESERDYTSLCARVTQPIVTVSTTDDLWAPPASTKAMMSGYVNAKVTLRNVTPDRGPIGHMGYFRPGAAHLWEPVLEWLRAVGG